MERARKEMAVGAEFERVVNLHALLHGQEDSFYEHLSRASSKRSRLVVIRVPRTVPLSALGDGIKFSVPPLGAAASAAGGHVVAPAIRAAKGGATYRLVESAEEVPVSLAIPKIEGQEGAFLLSRQAFDHFWTLDRVAGDGLEGEGAAALGGHQRRDPAHYTGDVGIAGGAARRQPGDLRCRLSAVTFASAPAAKKRARRPSAVEEEKEEEEEEEEEGGCGEAVRIPATPPRAKASKQGGKK